MQDIAKPRTLDVAAEVLVAARRFDQAGIILGAALAAKLPTEYSKVRDTEQQRIQDNLVAAIGEDQAERLVAEGRALGVDEALSRARGWLATG